MEADNVLSLLWCLFGRLFISHVLFGEVQSAVGGGRLSGTKSELRLDAAVWNCLHFRGGSLYECSFLGERLDIYDDLCVGTKE